jgi:hypothetical protein
VQKNIFATAAEGCVRVEILSAPRALLELLEALPQLQETPNPFEECPAWAFRR